MSKSPKSTVPTIKVGDTVTTENTHGIALQVDTFITKAGEHTLRIQVGKDDGTTKWVTIK